MKHESLLRRKDTALVVVDIQEKLLPAMHGQDKILKYAQILVTAAQVLQLPVIFTEQYPKGLGHTLPVLREAAPEAPVIEKLHFSCARAGGFEEVLKKTGASQILLCGIETHVCVLQTAFDLGIGGRQVHVAADAVGSRDPENRENALMRMRRGGIIITNAESALFELLDCAGGEEFKAVSRLVR